MRTPNPNPATKERLFQEAERLMRSKGFVATTVDEICEAAGVTKGSFFHYFSSKEDLAKTLLRQVSQLQKSKIELACCQAEDPLDWVYEAIDCAVQISRDPDLKGCLIGTFAQEISETHPELRCICEASFDEFAKGIAKKLVEAKAKHAPKASFDVKALGDYFLAVVQGSFLLMKTKQDRGLMEKNLEHFKSYLQNLFGR